MAAGVLDTHALLWWTLDPGQLSPAASDLCGQMERDGGLASSISVWELGLKLKRGQLVLPLAFEAYVRRLQQLAWLEVVPVDADLWQPRLLPPS